jgi:nucleotide-binding universal stress UspA family protein
LAEEQAADLLVIGAEHRLIFDKTVIGTTAAQLLRHAPCAVLAVTGGIT